MPDCKALCDLLKNRPINPRISKWVYYLCSFDYDFIYRPGARNHADDLSRITYPNYVTQQETEPPIDPYLDAITLQAVLHPSDTDSLTAGSSKPNSIGANDLLVAQYTTPCVQTSNRIMMPCMQDESDTHELNEIVIVYTADESLNRAQNDNVSPRKADTETNYDLIPYPKLTPEIIEAKTRLKIKTADRLHTRQCTTRK